MTNTYNDIPEVERETADGIRTVSLLTDALTGREVFLFGNIDENLVFSFTMQMLKLMEDEQSEINIYINSPGGEVNAGLAIYDLIQSCRAPIWAWRQAWAPLFLPAVRKAGGLFCLTARS